MAHRMDTLQARMTKQPPFTIEATGYTPQLGETVPRRSPRAAEKLQASPEEGILTVFDIVTRGANKFGDLHATGSRKLIKKHHETKKVKKVVDGKPQEVDKKWTYFELSGYSYMSFKDYETLVLQLGSGLQKLGLTAHDRLHMFASTSAHWLSMAHGAMSQSMSIVTAYDTLGEEGLRTSLVATKAKAIFLEPHLLKTFINTLRDAKAIQYIITNTDGEAEIDPADLETLKKSHDGLTVLSYEDLRQMGVDNPVDPVPPKPEDLCCIMYTSGSSGAPKGVELTHTNVVAGVTGATSAVGDCLGPGDCLLAYLPLAHIFEFVFENACLYWGGTMGYGSIRTLSQANCRNCKGDIEELKPTLMVGIPAVWEQVRKGVIANINKGGPALRTLFWGAYRAKKFLVENGLPGAAVLDALVFKKVQAATGGRLRFTMNGAAQIARDTQLFISLCIAPMINGYGMTETSAMGALCDPREFTADAHGGIPSCIEVKLVDFPDAGYFSTNTPNPQGEIWIRGESIMRGYYQDEAQTAEAIAPGGWFKTGDIGEWDKYGHLKVIDRKKNLAKTLNGEYIALEKLESIYRSATIVVNICMYASITETNPIAIIVPGEPALKAMAQELGVDGLGLEDLSHDKKVQAEVLKQLQAVGKQYRLANIEMIVGVVVADEEWTAQNGLITATNKLNRRTIIEHYKAPIEEAYKKARV
ncbi:Acetyl-CoA synthetase-like protein [Venustampulla echinocandica]|uniref:Acetyl-CoA synthetase-like protein n=1 Tax=Venustampulla echinocandica TaxID=2656787 RepID=A0A370U3K8_9HELO|nr:Acetyl-CoA synthetase-like protein [Venustampulla echinocandica]RDL42362.1 Acetyl-CoA synthetase-like protein [Venustampulla echinocandica]